ncbi:hypothetical protein Q5424_10600 [Conexibacter sp. JD483]|uniref:hypothetical protein n=1 Tax=unclassified Conexibacter TaxID=2627773 RepID=UPI002722614D|nr:MULTISPECIES: hypothetical protein [unclassified Conexibacter]MDO8187494.1 hypothetical protein [Conexibacter sp. CPCC 205706]MDO8199263.1 hypothetical protein [Conexibacter sp. CPCC 205762]MDR9369532.1 hypothetical protein [Conexibacter sp. JD483]
MTAILTPPLALRHLRQLTTDVRAAVVLAAGDLAVLAREPAGRADAPTGTVLAISGERHVLAVLAGPHALLPLLRHDLETLLADMGDEGASSSVQVFERADSAVSAAIFAGLGFPAAGKA